MADRPFWSGQLKVSLVSFGIQLYPATNSKSGVSFHQIDRASGQRIRHQNVVGDGDKELVENSEIVKGYEYSKGQYIVVEPDEISKLRIETKKVIDVQQFVDVKELPPAVFEKPYFVVPEDKGPPAAFAVVRKAMKQAGNAAIGEIAFGGCEHLVAIAVPPDGSAGLMAYMLRYAEELRKSEDYFSEIPLFDESEELVRDALHDEVRNAILMASARRIRQYEIAIDGATTQFARVLGRDEDRRKLEEITEDERAEDRQLNNIAERINPIAKKAA